ncbi:putative transcription factor MYB-HB-like family [Helianthus annuus]|uniref:Putative transcription factor DIVARICATA n=1 Tax=Helianthus annuus TaxID=4232 RepID=A0A251UY93_HELAN|nr:transcription factor DIVARICATA [Helianthus annuus]KAF5809848.1 putative transcription factor MYB-related family [Helianthus annuus]KAJ0580806.1 putative transcription factor MYB/SANT family [Helianthus annuus]KAJ0588512.1 putative transcription factor MYB/SANT family [Helianthus annuus]KAJ0596751.1 putative transcription factor MYB/SANT family [Helianthus annuus]KAJ0757429.1 putative transcription factor MYB/SANT family [Helianthus annuus]
MKWETANSSSWMMEDSLKSTIWTPVENKLFENALAKFDKDTPDRWQRVAEMVPGKTVADVMKQYKELEDDVSSIEAGLYPKYGYNCSTSSFTLEWGNNNEFDGFPYRKRSAAAAAAASVPMALVAAGRPLEQERKKGVPWTEEEHKLFLLGLKKYGKGDWRNISRNFVVTRTPTQVASHAQKYFIRQLSGGKDKRRASIHDITTVNLNENSGSSSEYKTAALPEQCKFQWNQPNSESTTMDLNQAYGNMFMSPTYGGTMYGGGGLQIGVPNNMVFQMQTTYPL